MIFLSEKKKKNCYILPFKILSQHEPKVSAKPKEKNAVIDTAISDPGLLRKTEISLWSQTLRITKGEEKNSMEFSIGSERKIVCHIFCI